MLIVEYLHLLLTRAEGTPETWSYRTFGETGALLTDLMVAERVVLSDEKRPRVEVISTAPTGHPVLDAALPLVAQRSGKRLESVITWSKLDPKDTVVQALVDQGVLRRGDRTFFGLGSPRTPEQNPEPEQEIRARLTAVLAGHQVAGIAEATLLGILQGMTVARQILREESVGLGLSSWTLKKRIEAVVAESAAGTAVERAVQAMSTAVTMTAIAAMGGAAGS